MSIGLFPYEYVYAFAKSAHSADFAFGAADFAFGVRAALARISNEMKGLTDSPAKHYRCDPIQAALLVFYSDNRVRGSL
jgi:hypothetical protein